MKKIFTLLLSFILIGWTQAQTFTVTNTNANGAGSFDAAFNAATATAAGSVVDINFNIPGAGPHTINVGWLNTFGNRTIRINGNTQPGYAVATPLIIFSSTQYRIFELDGGNNHLIRGLIFQNAQNGIVIKAGSGHRISSCWFGLSASGAPANRITECGIIVDNYTGTGITIGGATLDEGNIITNCGSDNYQNHHGVNLNNSRNVTISNNIISGNLGCGIIGKSTSNVIIIGNRIGTNSAGNQPNGNGTAGIRFENGSSNIRIGGSSTAERNIISANGLNSVPNSPNYDGEEATRFEWSNMSGIYFKGVTNSTIQNNFIGTDNTGNSTGSANNLGNFNTGIKVEQSSSGCNILGNVFGGNGFRSAEQALLTPPSGVKTGQTYKGHGALIKDFGTSSCVFKGNYVGLGIDGVSLIGNRQDGLSIQGASNLTVGGTSTVDRNYFADNIYGIFVSSDYSDDLSKDIFIYGNFIGTDVTGTIAKPNGKAGEGAGIGHRDNCDNIFVGGSASGQSNLISGNLNGVYSTLEDPQVAGKVVLSANKLIVKNNYIGVLMDGITAFPNTNYGILIEKKSDRNLIGGSAPNEGNIISSNTLGGILLNNATNNNIRGNRIGVAADGTTSRPNGGNGVQIQNTSTGNVIGGTAATAGNIIVNHPQNGIEIKDATSINNAIRNNSISCNTLRGIELNALGNNNYAKPTFTGSETAITVTGATGDWIEIYALDGCNDCVTNTTNNKLQGKTLLASGLSPLAFAGTAGVKYTATATQGGTAALPGNNTSEFTNCYTLCFPPNTSNSVVTAVASPICLGSAGGVTVTNTLSGVTYQAMINGTNAGASVLGTGATITLTIPAASLTPEGVYRVDVTARTLPSCDPVTLADSANIRVNKTPVQVTATGSVICSNATSGTVTVTPAESGVVYSAYKGATLLAGQTYSAGVITVPIAALTEGNNTITVRGNIPGCNEVTMTDTANIRVNKEPAQLTATGSTICSNATSGTVTISGSEAGVIYTAYKGSTLLAGQTYNAGVITIPMAALTNPGDNNITIRANIPGCTEVVLTDTANIKVNELPVQTTATGSTICSNSTNGTVTIANPTSGVTYVAYIGATQLAGQSYSAGVITVPIAALTNNPGDNTITVHANIPGCASVIMTDTANIKVNPLPSQKTFTASGPICEGTQTAVKLTNPDANVSYTVTDVIGTTTTVLSPVLNAAGEGSYALTGIGLHTLSIKADIAGCATIDMNATATVQVNKGVDPIQVSGIPNTPLCSDDNSFTLTIDNPELSVSYDVYERVGTTDTKLNTLPLNTASPSFTISNIAVGVHNYIIKGIIAGCGSADIYTMSVTVNEKPSVTTSVALENDTICVGQSVTMTIAGKIGVTYVVTDELGATLATQTATADGDLNVVLGPFTGITTKTIKTFTVTASITGCTTVTLDTKPSVVINPNPNADLVVEYGNINCDDKPNTITVKAAQAEVTYSVFLVGGAQVGASQVGNGADLIFDLGTLAEGTYNYEVRATVGGCATLTLDQKPSIRINKKPNADDFTVTADDANVCEGNSITVSVDPTKSASYTYTLLNNNTSAGVANITGNLGRNSFAAVQLPIGTHNLQVIESVTGCLSDTSDAIVVKVDSAINVTRPQITASSNVICEDGTVTFTLTGAQNGVSYTLKDNGAVAETKTATADNETLTFGPRSVAVTPAEHTFTLDAKSVGCDTVRINSSVVVKVNAIPNPETSITNNSPICITGSNTSAVLNIGIESGVTYYVYRKAVVQDSLLGSTNTNTFQTDPYTKAGKDTLIVVAEIPSCAAVELNRKQFIVINEFPDLNLASDGSSVCFPSDAQVTLYNTDDRWLYTASTNDTSYAKMGGGNIDFGLSQRKLGKGMNIVTFTVFVPGCGSEAVARDTVYSIGEIIGLTGPTIVCRGSICIYEVPPVPGASSYKFEVPPGATILSQDNNRISVEMGDSSGYVRVTPNSSAGLLCDKLVDSLYVAVYAPYDGEAGFINEDTVCVGTIDLIGVTGLLGVAFDSLVQNAGILYLDTIATPNGYNRYLVQYTVPNMKYTHTYYIYNPCDGWDTLTQSVVVLPDPKAVAGSYPVIDMRYYPREVVLDGSSSTKGDEFIYNWTMKPASSINNSNSIIASFVPQQTHQVAYLTVANAHKGMCPSVDSAVIVIDLGIFIPNVFTPNGDGDHDDWLIENVNAFYPNVTIDVYSKWGTLVYSSTGYPKPWDGKRNDQDLPSATYYYVIDLKKPGFKPIAGSVTILR